VSTHYFRPVREKKSGPEEEEDGFFYDENSAHIQLLRGEENSTGVLEKNKV